LPDGFVRLECYDSDTGRMGIALPKEAPVGSESKIDTKKNKK
jgi:hypothetical protein